MKKHLSKLLSIVTVTGALMTFAVSCSNTMQPRNELDMNMVCTGQNQNDQTNNPMTPAANPVATVDNMNSGNTNNNANNSNNMSGNTNNNTSNSNNMNGNANTNNNNSNTESGTNNMTNETTTYKKPSVDEVFSFIANNRLTELEEYLKRCNNVEIKNGRGQTLLLAATNINNIQAAELLLKYKADVNAQDNIKDSPFLLAGARGYTELVKLFLNHNPRFDIFNRFGGTGLIPAAEKRHLETLKVLLSVPNYPIDHVNNLGWTALMEAIVLGSKSVVQTQIVKALIDGGVDITIPDRQGVSALENARRRGLIEIVQLLEQKQRQLNS